MVEVSQEAISEKEMDTDHIIEGRQGNDEPSHDVKAQEGANKPGQFEAKTVLKDNKKHVEGESWLHAKKHQLEQDLKDHGHSSEREREVMKGYIDRDIRAKLNELMGTLEQTQHLLVEKEHEKQRFEHGLHVKVEHYERKFESIKEQIECLLGELKSTLIKEMRENTSLDFTIAATHRRRPRKFLDCFIPTQKLLS